MTPTKSYGDLVALAPLDLAIRAGERVALVGHNGSGKSMFLGMTAGLLEPSDGSSEVAGAPAGASAARASVSFIPDDPVLYDDLSVREHLAYVAALQGVDAAVDAFDNLLDRIGLLHRADDLPARSLQPWPATEDVDSARSRPPARRAAGRRAVRRSRRPGEAGVAGVARQIHHDGSTVVVATHDPLYVERVDRCVALRDGQLIHDGPATPDDVLRLVCA